MTGYCRKNRGSRLGPDWHRTARLLSTLLSLIALVKSCYSASRRAGAALPGRVRVVQVECPAGRMTRTRRAWSVRLRCVAERRGPDAGIPERPDLGRAAPAAGGRLPVVGPGALPAGGRIVRHGRVTEPRAKNRGRSRSPPEPRDRQDSELTTGTDVWMR